MADRSDSIDSEVMCTRRRVDWKSSWREKNLVDFDRKSSMMVCIVCHLKMRCIRRKNILC